MQANKEQYPACNKVISHLTAVSEELVDVPLYFSLHDVCKTVKCTPPKADVLRSALINAGELSGSVQSALAMFQSNPLHRIMCVRKLAFALLHLSKSVPRVLYIAHLCPTAGPALRLWGVPEGFGHTP